MYDIGEKPGKGEYECLWSKDRVTLDDSSDKLPPCPSNKCSEEHTTKWVKIK
jgi:hypothetical protein